MEHIFSIILYMTWPMVIFATYRFVLWSMKKMEKNLGELPELGNPSE